MKITIHQPECFPYLGFIDKISKTDIFVIADSFQVKKNYYDNRNKIRTSQGWQWIGIPIEKDNHKSFRDVKVIHQDNWQKKILTTIQQNYSKTPFFDKYYPTIEGVINAKLTFLFDYNYPILCHILSWFGADKIQQFTSSFKLESNNGSDKCLEICQKLKTDTYLSGSTGRTYLDLDKFKSAGINVDFHQFFHPVYHQRYQPFLPGISSIDLLFNYGDRAKEILKAKGIGSLENILSKIDYKDKQILEMFGGNGSGHLQAYADKCDNLTLWEMNHTKLFQAVGSCKPLVACECDSLKEMLNIKWQKHFDIIIIDPPAMISMDQILPNALNMLKDDGIVIFRAIKKSYNQNTDIKVDKSLEDWDKIIECDYQIKNKYEEPREFYFFDHWLSNYVYELRRKK